MIFDVPMVLVHRMLAVAPTGQLSRVIRAPAIRRDDHNRRGKYRRHTRNDQRSSVLRGLDHCYLSVTGPVGRVRHMSATHCFNVLRPLFLLPIARWLFHIVLLFFFTRTSSFRQVLRVSVRSFSRRYNSAAAANYDHHILFYRR